MSEQEPIQTHDEWVKENPDFQGVTTDEYRENVPDSNPEEDFNRAFIQGEAAHVVLDAIKGQEAEIANLERSSLPGDVITRARANKHKIIGEMQDTDIPKSMEKAANAYDEIELFAKQFRDSIELRIADNPADTIDVEGVEDEDLKERIMHVQESIKESKNQAKVYLSQFNEQFSGLDAEGYINNSAWRDYPQHNIESWRPYRAANVNSNDAEQSRKYLKSLLDKAGIVYEEDPTDLADKARDLAA